MREQGHEAHARQHFGGQLAYLWGFSASSRFRPYACCPPTGHPTVLFSEPRVKHLGVQDGLSPLRCELPRSPLCGPRFPPLQTGLGSELLGPLLPSLSLSLSLSPFWFTLGPGFSNAGAYPPHYSPAPSHSCLGLTSCKKWS